MVKQTNSQTQFLQIVCVVLVMTTIISLMSAYFLYRDVTNLEAELVKAKQLADSGTSENIHLIRDIKALKNITGYNLPKVGELDSVEENTIVSEAQKEIEKLVGLQETPTLRNAMTLLDLRLKDIIKERNALKVELNKYAPAN